MPPGEFNVPLSLSTIAGLDEVFVELAKRLTAALKHGEKAAINITVTFKRIENTNTMLNVAYSVAPKFPPRTRAAICQVTNDGALMTEEPPAKPKVVQMHLTEQAKE